MSHSCDVRLYECGKWWWWWWQNENEPVESLVILSPAKSGCAWVEMDLNTTDTEVQNKEQKLSMNGSLPKMQIGTNNTEKTPNDSDDSEWQRGSTDKHRMQQREVSLAHNLLEIMFPCKMRTWKSNRKRWSMYRTGCVYSTVCACTCLCCGVARLTTTQISQHTPWGLTLPKKKRKKERNDKRKRNDHPLEPHIPKCDQPKHPNRLPSKQTKIQEYKGTLPKS